jgi:hypothetical protein
MVRTLLFGIGGLEHQPRTMTTLTIASFAGPSIPHSLPPGDHEIAQFVG